jgi:hypothetical protein
MIIDCVRAHLAPGTSANVRSTEEISAPSVSIENRVVRVWTKPRDIRLSVFAWEGGILESNISLSRCRESVCLWGRCHRMPQDARRKTHVRNGTCAVLSTRQAKIQDARPASRECGMPTQMTPDKSAGDPFPRQKSVDIWQAHPCLVGKEVVAPDFPSAVSADQQWARPKRCHHTDHVGPVSWWLG